MNVENSYESVCLLEKAFRARVNHTGQYFVFIGSNGKHVGG